MGFRFSEEWEIHPAVTITAGAAGATAVNGAILDMLGYSDLVVVAQTGAIVSGAVTSMKLQQGAAANLSDAADLAGTGITIADDDDDKAKYLDVKWDATFERYVRVVISRATQNATVSAVYYRRKRTLPGSHAATVAGERHTSPAEGTA